MGTKSSVLTMGASSGRSERHIHTHTHTHTTQRTRDGHDGGLDVEAAHEVGEGLASGEDLAAVLDDGLEALDVLLHATRRMQGAHEGAVLERVTDGDRLVGAHQLAHDLVVHLHARVSVRSSLPPHTHVHVHASYTRTDSWMMRRRRDVQRWPAVPTAPKSAPRTTCSRSASGITTVALLPLNT
jgi:hypothetical protein